MGYKYKVIQKNNVCFILTPYKIYIQTPLQTCILMPTEGYWLSHFAKLRQQITAGRINSLSELAGLYTHKVRWYPCSRIDL